MLRSVRDIIPPQELDIYIPELKLAIEFNGTYWHNERTKANNYHQKKKLECLAAGITLIHVHEFLWNNRSEQILDLIRSHIQLPRTIFARKCVTREITREVSDRFCEANHIQGKATAKHHIGLFHGDELVGVFTASKSRFDRSYQWEIIRICFARGTRVTGGAGKMLKHFERHVAKPGDRVCSYAQLDWSNGAVYGALGFRKVRETEPGYRWIHEQTGEVVPRYKAQKHKLKDLLGDWFDADETELQNMHRAGYVRLFDAGCRLYEKTLG